MIHEYDVETNVGPAKFKFDDDKELVTVTVENGNYNFTINYDLIDKLYTQLEDIRFTNKMQGKKD